MDLVAGQNRAAERKKHEEASQIAIVLVSPSLVADGRVRTRLAALRRRRTAAVPDPADRGRRATSELGALQGLESCPRDMRAFREQRGKPAKERFALAAWQELEIALERATLRSSRLDLVKSPGPHALLDDSVRTALELPRHLVDARGRISSLRLRGRCRRVRARASGRKRRAQVHSRRASRSRLSATCRPGPPIVPRRPSSRCLATSAWGRRRPAGC